jgi:hypothetical protein
MTAASPITLLRRFARPGDSAAAREHCDLCSAAIGAGHRHLFDPAARRLICACDGCALLFPESSAKYIAVPRRVLRLRNFSIGEGQWDGLGVPIGLAFFSCDSATSAVRATYPSPAGTTESELPAESWNELAAQNEVLSSLAPDVEALLVNRTRGRRDYYIASIDRCYQLAGVVRRHWRGLSGGSEVWDAVNRFFDDLARVADA